MSSSSGSCDKDEEEEFEMSGDPQAPHYYTWHGFVRKTSFHGVKYLFDGHPWRIRKLLWALSLLGAITLFGTQMIDRCREYFRYTTNVNVELDYTQNLVFPTVTICNYNSFRLSVAKQMGVYDYLDEVFTHPPTGDLALPIATKPIGNVSLTDIITQLAHQKEDFIDSCEWRGKSCNIANDFVTTLTDFGVCYTFNSLVKQDDLKEVNQSGAGLALMLALNIEQYEYMKGAQDEAGIKVLLHDPSETPLIQDFGFAISPGAHALVAVNRQLVYSLEDPYGDCVMSAPPRSVCTSNCRAKAIVNRCGCRTPDMPEIGNATICDVTSAFGCVRKELADITADLPCTCPIPCKRVTYTPELSYAQLTKMSLDRVAPNDPARRNSIEERYKHALELQQRVIVDIINQDYNQGKAVETTVQAYNAALGRGQAMLTDTSIIERTYNVFPEVIDAGDMITADSQMLIREHTSRSEAITKSYPKMTYTTFMTQRIQAMTDIMTATPVPLRKRLTDYCQGKNYTAPLPRNYDSCDELNSSPSTYLYIKRQRCIELNNAEDEATAVAEIDNMASTYQKLIDYLYGMGPGLFNADVQHGPLLIVDFHEPHVQCIDILTKTREAWLSRVQGVYDAADLYLKLQNWTAKIQPVDYMNEVFVNASTDPDSITKLSRYEPCYWYVLSYEQTDNDEGYQNFLSYKDSALESNTDQVGLRPPLAQSANVMLNVYSSLFTDLLVKPTTDFLLEKKTKLQLQLDLTSSTFKTFWDKLLLSHNRFMTDFSVYITKISDVHNQLRTALVHAFNSTVPIMNRTIINNLAFVQMAKAHSQNDSELYRAIELLDSDMYNGLLQLADLLFTRYENGMQEEQNRIILAFRNMRDAVYTLQDNLDKFATKNDMNRNKDDFLIANYIKLNIFYKELTYELIEQQMSFQFISLMSEIGGMMGLLLGASVLTICEFFDFVAMLGYRRRMTRRNRNRQLRDPYSPNIITTTTTCKEDKTATSVKTIESVSEKVKYYS